MWGSGNVMSITFLKVKVINPEQPKKSEVLVPIEERHVPVPHDQSFENTKQNADAESEIKREINRPQQSVIVALLDEADTHANAGHSDKASAFIERALRIEPNNALLWHRLALIRVQQQEWQQAIALARKSNALVVNNPGLKSANWGIIADAYEKLGDKQKAKEARQKQKLQG